LEIDPFNPTMATSELDFEKIADAEDISGW
jgi:hypothetical protein